MARPHMSKTSGKSSIGRQPRNGFTQHARRFSRRSDGRGCVRPSDHPIRSARVFVVSGLKDSNEAFRGIDSVPEAVLRVVVESCGPGMPLRPCAAMAACKCPAEPLSFPREFHRARLPREPRSPLPPVPTLIRRFSSYAQHGVSAGDSLARFPRPHVRTRGFGHKLAGTFAWHVFADPVEPVAGDISQIPRANGRRPEEKFPKASPPRDGRRPSIRGLPSGLRCRAETVPK